MEGGLGNNTIHSLGGTDSLTVQDKSGVSDPNGYDGNLEVLDYDAGDEWSFPIDSGARLGASCTSVEVQVFVSWDYPADPGPGKHWVDHVQYTLCENGVPFHTVPVDQGTGDPNNHGYYAGNYYWTDLGQYTIPTGDTLKVELSTDTRDPNDPNDDPLDGCLWADAVMIHPLWPTVTVRGGQSDQPYTEKDDWLQSWQPISVPVEGDGNDRAKVELSASIDTQYGSVSDWQAVLPNVPGLEFWTAATGGTQLTADGSGYLIDQALTGGLYTGTVYVSQDPSFAATEGEGGATLQQIAFHAEIVSPEAGDPSGGDVVDLVQCTAIVESDIGKVNLLDTGNVDTLDQGLNLQAGGLGPYRIGTQSWARFESTNFADAIKDVQRYSKFSDEAGKPFPTQQNQYLPDYKQYYWMSKPIAGLWIFARPFAITVDYHSVPNNPVYFQLQEKVSYDSWNPQTGQWQFDPQVTETQTGQKLKAGATSVTFNRLPDNYASYRASTVAPDARGPVHTALFDFLKKPTGANGQDDQQFVLTDTPTLANQNPGVGIRETVEQVVKIYSKDGKDLQEWGTRL